MVADVTGSKFGQSEECDEETHFTCCVAVWGQQGHTDTAV